MFDGPGLPADRRKLDVKKMGEACQFGNNLNNADSLVVVGGYAVNNWYALKVRVGSEATVVNALLSRGLNPYCPTQKERRRYSDRMKVVERPVFPGYVFCSFDIEKKLPIVSCPGVDYIVGFAGTAAAIPELQIESIRRIVCAGAVTNDRFVSGDKIRITHGPLAGVEGVLVREPRGTRLVVSIELLNQSASLFIEQDQIVAA